MKHLLKITSLILTLTFLFVGCGDDNGIDTEDGANSIIPDKFRVDIPDAISYEASQTKSGNEDSLISGADLYEALGVFIAIGDGAAQVVESIMLFVNYYEINEETHFSYTAEEDGRDKLLTVIAGAEFEGVTYDYELTIIDSPSENNADGGKALQVFWNSNPVKGVAIMKPYNIDMRGENLTMPDALYRVDYSEASELGYDAEMTVSISGLPLDTLDLYSVDNLKMWAGKKGSVVDLYGNSNHPTGMLLDSTHTGFSWAFVASADATKDIAVAELGLPSNTANISSRTEILIDNSVKSVLKTIIGAWLETTYGVDINDQTWAPLVNTALKDAEAPAYFNSGGFIQAGTAPSNNYSSLVTNITVLTPFNPSIVNSLEVQFK